MRDRSRWMVLSVSLLGFFSGGLLSAADSPYWPRFHGPNGNNISTEGGLLNRWPEGGPNLIWTAKGIGQGFSSVTLADGFIYTAGNLRDRTVVTALDLSGKIRWQADCGKAWIGSHVGTRGTPTLDGDRIYYETPHGDVVCLNAATGEEIWGLQFMLIERCTDF